MFNHKRIKELEEWKDSLEAWRGDVEKRLGALEDAAKDRPYTYRTGIYACTFIGRGLRKVCHIDERITRLMDHFGLREETIHEHTTIVKEKK